MAYTYRGIPLRNEATIDVYYNVDEHQNNYFE